MKKIVAISLVLVMVLSFTACGGEELPSAQEIIDGSNQAMVDMRTCQFDLDMSLDIDGEADSESVEGTIEIDASGVLDIENMQMQMAMTMNAAVTGEDEMDIDMEMYLVDNNFYIMLDIPGMGPMWMKSEMLDEMLEEILKDIPEDYWDPTELMELQTELLEAFEHEVTGNEKVGGVDCYVLEITVDIAQLWQLIMQQLDDTALEMADIPENFEELLDEMFRNFSIKQWIAKDTYLISKVEMELDMELTSETMAALDAEGEMAIDMVLTLLLYDYNEPVSIELPPEAEEAVEMPMGF